MNVPAVASGDKTHVYGGVPRVVAPPATALRVLSNTGYLAGYPLQDVRVTVYDGKSHPVDSKEVAFVSAGRKAFLDALGKARPIVLEPIVNVEITAPETKMGDVAGELSGNRGNIKGSDAPRPGSLILSPAIASTRPGGPTTQNAPAHPPVSFSISPATP